MKAPTAGEPEDARLRDAVKYLREAEKNTEKGWFRKPDWDIAAQYFEKAGQAFKAGKSYEQAIQAFMKASDSMIYATSLFMAGRALENAANIALQNLGQAERAADMYKRASDLYLRNMTPDRAAELLEKGAKAIEPISVDAALDYYIGACNIYESEDRARYATGTFKRTISLLVKHRRFEKALEALQRLGNVQKDTPNKSAYFKTLLSIVIVQLAAGDEVDAGKRFQAFCSIEGFVQSEESAVAHAMLDAFEHRDQAYYNQAANRQHVGFLDNEVARLAHNIVISDDLISGGGYVEPGSTQPPPQNSQQPYYQQQGPPPPGPGPAKQTGVYQQSPKQLCQPQPQPPYQQPYQQPRYDQKDIYQARPTSQTANYCPQSGGTTAGFTGEYSNPPFPSSGPPSYSDQRNDDDWRQLTEKQPPATAPPSTLPPQPRQSQQPGAPPNRSYYQDVDEDDDDGLL